MLECILGGEQAAEECAICFEPLAEDANGPAVFLSGCGLNSDGIHSHGFHLACIVLWRAAGAGTLSCPVCREQTPGAGKRWEYEDSTGARLLAPARGAIWSFQSACAVALECAGSSIARVLAFFVHPQFFCRVLPVAVLVLLSRRDHMAPPEWAGILRIEGFLATALRSLARALRPSASGAALEEAHCFALLGAAL
jgi:hypothetical protein